MDVKSLRNKTLIISAVYFIITGLFLFWPAGTLDYWQAWLYMFIFIAASIPSCWYLLKKMPRILERRIMVNPLAEPDINQKYIQIINSVFIFALFGVSGWDFGKHGARFSDITVLLADMAMLAGLWMIFLVVKVNQYASAAIKVEPGQPVADKGLYSKVRHPMYLGAILYICATPPALGSVLGLWPAALLGVGIVARLLMEEDYLKANLPGYKEYCEKVRYRLIPNVW